MLLLGAWSATPAFLPGHDHGGRRQSPLGAHQPSCGNVFGTPVVPAFNPQDAGTKPGPRGRTAFDVCCFDSYGCLEVNLDVPKPEVLEARDSLE